LQFHVDNQGMIFLTYLKSSREKDQAAVSQEIKCGVEEYIDLFTYGRKMTQSRFFQISLLLPFALWCLCLLVFSLAYKEGAAFILNNLYNACRVFVPYLIFAAVVWKLASGKSYRLLIPLASVVPIVWGAFFTLFYILISYIMKRAIDAWYVLCIMAFWATVVAYLAEIIPFLILTIFKDDFKPCQGRTPLDHRL
jgi:hypothetical protein